MPQFLVQRKRILLDLVIYSGLFGAMTCGSVLSVLLHH